MDDFHFPFGDFVTPQHIFYYLLHTGELGSPEDPPVMRQLVFDDRYDLFVAAEFSRREALYITL